MGLIEKPSDPHGLTLEAWAQVCKKTKIWIASKADLVETGFDVR
jgi:hypothetical protein